MKSVTNCSNWLLMFIINVLTLADDVYVVIKFQVATNRKIQRWCNDTALDVKLSTVTASVSYQGVTKQ